MSGCGVFIVAQMVPGQLWAPRVVLAGIQSGWHKTFQPPLIRAKRIEWIKDLLEQVADSSA